MEKKVLKVDEIIEKKFPGSASGYNPLEVDKFLDSLVLSINELNNHIDELHSMIQQKDNEISKLNKEIETLNIQVSTFKVRYSNLKETDFIDNKDTINLIKKINIYEKELNNLGVDIKQLIKKYPI